MLRLENPPVLRAQFEILRQRVKVAKDDSPINPTVIAFTSVEPGEGVTTVASNFAASLADDTEQLILLVDGNAENPSLYGLFHHEYTPGLIEVMQYPGSVWPVYRAGENLDVMFAGMTRNGRNKTFKSERVIRFFEELRSRYAITVLDCPPVSGKEASSSLAAKADAVVLVVQAERVRREVVKRQIEILEEGGANLMGIVLNKRRYPIPRMIYRML